MSHKMLYDFSDAKFVSNPSMEASNSLIWLESGLADTAASQEATGGEVNFYLFNFIAEPTNPAPEKQRALYQFHL